MTGWGTFAEGLVEELAALPAGAIVKIYEAEFPQDAVHRYAQFLQLEDRLCAELVGEEWLDPTMRAGDAGCRVIAGAGWVQPDDNHHGNWWFDLPWPADTAGYRQLVSMVVTGLRDGLRMANPTMLVYEAWNEREGNSALDLPQLGLAQRE
ncbi:hypothetical protein ALI144C_33145 [Actinosynnema sp. ALI-1.44]|uniref:TY-Chap domain-containing protein n=1 Tax=Actinosynnema sp. ALI-1.44 TaxID=1933779 RepID=UPI00097C0818|nr:hypothetical protein [Actinosynnema sp. ALI-1.44]ONI76969.1 hypothetical protein ALI144C_33145 [Actinosynnema sp. ALI-1.44]